MPLFTSSRQLPKQKKAPAEEDLAGDGTVAGQDDAVRERTTEGENADADEGRSAKGPGWRQRHPRAARVVTRGTSVLAALLVFTALVLPNAVSRLTPSAFTRIPVEAILGAGILLALKARVRKVTAIIGGVCLGLVTVLKFLDMGFYQFLARPFDIVLDWVLFDDLQSFLEDSLGQAGAVAASVGVLLLVVALVVLTTLAVVRLSDIMVRHNAVAVRSVLALGTVWILLTAFGAQVDDVQVASRSTTRLVHNRTHQVSDGLQDGRAFAKQSAVDKFSDTPKDELLTGLRGKNVLFTFIESYGRSAVQDPRMAPHVAKVLKDSTSRLDKAGYASRSGYLTSPISGAGSWLAHSTFNSGLWIDNQQRYRTLTSSDRFTLTGAFRRTEAWRTVGIMPGVTKSWPEGKFYGLDHVYDSRELGYKGPKFSWSPVPDQFSLAAFERLEHSKKNHKPLMAEIILASSHNPWAPLPRMLPWNQVGDGSIYHSIKKQGKRPTQVWRDPDQVRNEYRRAVEYSMQSLTAYLEKWGDDDTVVVVLGDHQPVPVVTGNNASRDVPISIIARDKKVMDRMSGWEWKDGLNPGPEAPVWRMDTFRDRFMTTYGPQSESSSKK